ncbi:ABC transporter ATP-binding protein [Psittacicella gerlachiana]|uniref:Iron-hydroxamate transporter ATP-binding subunit n=1 Tax=Psittacicella gerlachiana TaxID=2028574 RepID=A0A3A1YKQ3_9GAMM|nr:ATP-binding cassette domain-containing protein [Psittacicella gerlachiana]RIY38762.1 iron-hydroxamate transporter ATP-binding subunit [Psittacicella gerlachiana]
MFKLSNVEFNLEGRALLAPLSMEFLPGKVYGLIGHNGSGKSTLLKLLARQETPSMGSILFLDREIKDYKAKEFARSVAYLPQYLPVQTFLTASELVAMGRFAWQGLFSRSSDEDKKIVAESLKLTNTEKFAHSLVDNLSGGERSRVWLAMLLAQKTQFILLDEPLAALDVAHQVEVMKLLKDLSVKLGIGIIIVIHDINLAARFCDKLVALHTGKVIFEGDAQQLMQEEVLKDIYNIDLTVIDHPHEAGVKVSFY